MPFEPVVQVDRRRSRGDERDERHAGESYRQEDRHADAVLPDREELLVRGVGGLELPGFAVEHRCRQTRSMRRSPNKPSGRTRRKASAST